MSTFKARDPARPRQQHPFGNLLAQFRARKPGLTQKRLAELAGYDASILVRMSQGKKDLTGPSGRERIVRLMSTLADQGVLVLLDEANDLLLSADMAPLFHRQHEEAQLISRLSGLAIGQRVRRTNLPSALTSFVGRTQEVAEVRSMLGETRLLTLTGAGGCGKTRLAQRAAADMLISYSSGVWFVELATLMDADGIPDAVVRALGLAMTDTPARARVLEHLSERQALLVLDNCEHLIAAVARFCLEALQACPRLTILATSRESLDVDGEMVWRVPPMQPDEAGRLFVNRAYAARGGATLRTQDEAVKDICQQLDGMPLAIELAAAQAGTLGVAEIAARLNDRFGLLVGSRRGALPRHQTLRGSLEWSHDALSEIEKRVFQQLGVFVGGWELAQAEAVAVDGVSSPADVRRVMQQLERKSMVVIAAQTDTTRFQFLETVRQFALEHLARSGEAQARQRHAQAYLALVEGSTRALHGSEQNSWLARLRRDSPNILAALDWSLARRNDPLLGCRMVGALFHYWRIASDHREDARKWILLAKEALNADMPSLVQAWVWLTEECIGDVSIASEARSQRAHDLFVKGGDMAMAALAKTVIGRAVYYFRRDYAAALRWSEQGVEEARALGADWELRFGLAFLAECLRFGQRDPARAEATYREALALDRAAGDLNEVGRALTHYISLYDMDRSNYGQAIRSLQEALAIAVQTDDIEGANSCHSLIAQNMLYLGDVPRAKAQLEDSLSLASARVSPHGIRLTNRILARVALAQNAYAQARDLLIGNLRRPGMVMDADGFARGIHNDFDALAAVMAAMGTAAHAARLRGMADQHFALNGHYRTADVARYYAPYMATAHAALGGEVFDALYAEGRAMGSAGALTYARALADADAT